MVHGKRPGLREPEYGARAAPWALGVCTYCRGCVLYCTDIRGMHIQSRGCTYIHGGAHTVLGVYTQTRVVRRSPSPPPSPGGGTHGRLGGGWQGLARGVYAPATRVCVASTHTSAYIHRKGEHTGADVYIRSWVSPEIQGWTHSPGRVPTGTCVDTGSGPVDMEPGYCTVQVRHAK